MLNDRTMSATASLKINNIPLMEELSDEAATAISGGRFKKPLETVTNPGLSTVDGDPVQVYVDGILVNSVITGYYGGDNPHL